MKILLFGRNGQVGWELNKTLQSLGELIALGRAEADFSNPESLREIVQTIKPDIIVNAAAYTAVDKAEEEEDLAARINTDAPRILAEESKKLKALLVHYSTDYVFDGCKDSTYVESDEPAPVNAYGRTKLAGELAVQSSGCEFLIFRTSWVYASRGNNFLMTMLKLAQEREELSIVVDQVGSPTSANLIADTTAECLRQSISDKNRGDFSSGLYHLTASGSTSWFGFTEEIVRLAKNSLNWQLKLKELKPIPAAGYPTPANRPANSRLETTKLERDFSLKITGWKVLLAECMAEIR